MKRNYLSIYFILLLAFVLRVWTVGFGLPHAIHADEILAQHNMLLMVAKGFLSGFSGYAVLVVFITFPVYFFYYGLGRIFGWFSDPTGFYLSFADNQPYLLLVSRFLFVGVSVLLVWVTYLVGKKMLSHKHGLLAALLMSLTFLPVTTGYYVKDDTLVALLILSSFLCVKLKRVSFSGLLLGIAISSHYYPVALVPLFVLFIREDFSQQKSREILKFIVAGIVGFFLVNIHPLLNPVGFLTDFKSMLAFRERTTVSNVGIVRWLFFSRELFIESWGGWLLIISIIGSMVVLVTQRGRNILVTLLLLWFGLLVGGAEFTRFGMPVTPFLCLLTSIGVIYLFDFKRYRLWHFLSIVLVALTITPVLFRVILYQTLINSPDTRVQATEWIEKHIPAHSKIIVAGYQTPYSLPFETVYLQFDERILETERTKAIQYGQPTVTFDLLRKYSQGHTTYDVIGISKLDTRWNSQVGKYEVVADPEWLRGADYVITSSWNQNMNSIDGNFLAKFQKQWQPLSTFIPNPKLQYDPHNWRFDWTGINQIKLSQRLLFGPAITIYTYRSQGK